MYNFVFPGQGEQQVGMLLDIVTQERSVCASLDSFSELSGYDILQVLREGSMEDLTDAKLSGLLVVACSIALFDQLKQCGLSPSLVAGYSVGQYSALYAAGSIELSDLVRLLLARQTCLQVAAKETDSTMVSVIGVAIEKVHELQDKYNRFYISNYNCPNHVTVSCLKSQMDNVINDLSQLSPIQITPLPVAGGWHSPFVENYVSAFLSVLESVELKEPVCAFVDNVSGLIETDPETIRSNLLLHMFSPVLWQQSVKTIAGLNSDPYVEVGYGSQLSKFIKFTERSSTIFRSGTEQELKRTVEALAI